MTEHVKTVGML